ncbi:MAG: hypothetical protein MR209_00090 [Veillonellaceae bacterium]|nr:hypothetical protein [Veillonellaceae bacterium]
MTDEMANDYTSTPAAEEAAAGQETEQETATTAVPESYDFAEFCVDGVELDTERAEAYSEVLKNAGMSQAQAAAVTKYGLAYAQEVAQEAATQYEEAQAQEIAGWADEARAELGGQFEQTVAQAAIGVTYMEKSVPELRQMLDATGFGNRVEAIRLFAQIGQMVAEDDGRASRGSATGAGDVAGFYNNTDFSVY